MKTKAKWINLAVKPHFSWPDTFVEIPFGTCKIVLQPRRENSSAAVSIFSEEGLTFEKGGELLYKFLSRLAWSKNGGIVENFICGSNHPTQPGPVGQGTYGVSGFSQVQPEDYLYLPIPKSDKAALALGLFREAMSLNSVPYSFLGYFKVINICFESGPEQKAWINKNLSSIKHEPELKRLKHLQKNESDIGAYLYHQGRCAVAHAFDKHIANPDSYIDKRRLEDDIQLMKVFAVNCIEKVLGVKSVSSFWAYLKTKPGETEELLVKHVNDSGLVSYIPYKNRA